MHGSDHGGAQFRRSAAKNGLFQDRDLVTVNANTDMMALRVDDGADVVRGWNIGARNTRHEKQGGEDNGTHSGPIHPPRAFYQRITNDDDGLGGGATRSRAGFFTCFGVHFAESCSHIVRRLNRM